MGYPKALFFTYPDNLPNTKSMATLLAYAGGVGCPLRAPAPENRGFFLPSLPRLPHRLIMPQNITTTYNYRYIARTPARVRRFVMLINIWDGLLRLLTIDKPEHKPRQIIPPIQRGWVLTGIWAKKNPDN